MSKQSISVLGSIVFACSTTLCPAQESSSVDSERAERAAQLDTKVEALREQLKVLRTRWNDTSDQAKTNIAAELGEARDQLSKAFDEREAAFGAKVTRWSESMDSVWAQIEEDGQKLKAETSAELERLRKAWKTSHEEFRNAHEDHVEYLRDELNSIEAEAAAATSELSAEWVATRRGLRERYESNAKEMHDAYRQSIAAVDTEIARLDKAAKNASQQNRAKIEAEALALSNNMDVMQQELQASYRDASEKAQVYLAQTKSKLSAAGVEVKGQLQTEADKVSAVACQLSAELTECCEIYRDSLAKRFELLNQRAASVQGDAKRSADEMATELKSQMAKVDEQVVDAYTAYVEALSSDIDYAKERLSDADDRARKALISRIERRQADLQRAKERLQENARD